MTSQVRLRALWLAVVDVNAKFSTTIAPPRTEILQFWAKFYLFHSSSSEGNRGILCVFTELACGWRRQRWRRIFTLRRPEEKFPKSSRLSHTTAVSTHNSLFKNSKCKNSKPSQHSASLPLIETIPVGLCVERVDRQVDSIEAKENILYTGEVHVNNETKMEHCKETTENIGNESPTLNTCGLFDDLGKLNCISRSRNSLKSSNKSRAKTSLMCK